MDQKVNYKADKKNYSKDSVIILQGSSNREINFLHNGTVEIKRCGENIKLLQENEILKKSKRIGVVESPSIFGVQNLMNYSEHESSFIALTDCLITKYIIPSNNFVEFFKANPSISLNILLTMEEYAKKSLLNLKKYVDFIGVIDKLSDNFNLLYSYVTQSKKDEIYEKFISNSGIFPVKIESSFLTSDFSGILDKTYGDPNYNPNNKFERNQIDFFQNLIKTRPASFISLLTKEINIFLYIFDNLSSIIKSIDIETEKFASKIENKLNTFFLEGSSPFNKIYSIAEKIKKNVNIDDKLTKSIVKICRNIEHINKKLGGREYVEIFPKYDMLNADLKGVKPIKPVTSTGKFQKMFKDSTKIILSFSTLGSDQKERIIRNIKDMQKINPESILSKDTRALIKRLQDDYFELYQNLFLKTIKKSINIPIPVKLFLYFSFINERIITEEQLEFIYNSMNYYTKPQNTEYPIISLYDYLLLIYNKEEEPGLSEIGEFRKIVKKPFSRKEKIIEDTPCGRLDFEIDNMIRSSMRITSDNIRAYIPYLTEKSFKGDLNQIFVSPKKIDTFMKKIASIDYTLFFRELTWKIPGKSELIKKEIKPYFIIIPNAGLRVQMWQEMVYNLRSTRARFLIPVFFNGNINKSLIHSCGHFRWNMAKALVSNWMDPVDGGLAGAYYDYEQTYKKMMGLTIEAKEKIKEQIRGIKIDRARFATDYYEWILFESQGIPKLNKVLRKIFYRLIPFPKNIRDTISKLPVYIELDRKFNIVRTRDFKRIEARFRKYKEVDQLPEDLHAYLNILQG